MRSRSTATVFRNRSRCLSCSEWEGRACRNSTIRFRCPRCSMRSIACVRPRSIERQWEENRFTAEGRVLHDVAHDPIDRKRGTIRRVMALPLACRRLNLAGVADLVEFRADRDGETAYPVEYKRGQAKLHRADEVQLCAQGLCLEEMTGRTVPEGALFYAETRRRVAVPVRRRFAAPHQTDRTAVWRLVRHRPHATRGLPHGSLSRLFAHRSVPTEGGRKIRAGFSRARGRGSKLLAHGKADAAEQSPPSGGRGSKQCRPKYGRSYSAVASFTGAWIETTSMPFRCLSCRVASFTGAWIETATSQGNGSRWAVASFTGAWIETLAIDNDNYDGPSRLLQGGVDRNLGTAGRATRRAGEGGLPAAALTSQHPADAANSSARASRLGRSPRNAREQRISWRLRRCRERVVKGTKIGL
jgi:CRISPR-associated protein Cas4